MKYAEHLDISLIIDEICDVVVPVKQNAHVSLRGTIAISHFREIGEGPRPLDVAEWFLSPNPDLEQGDDGRALSPREWLLRGSDPAAVASIAALL